MSRHIPAISAVLGAGVGSFIITGKLHDLFDGRPKSIIIRPSWVTLPGGILGGTVCGVITGALAQRLLELKRIRGGRF